MDIPKTFADLIVLIGSPLFIGVVMSLLIKEWVWFQDKAKWVKWAITLGICIILPVISQALRLYLPPAAWAFLEQWWPVVASGMGVWVASQVWNQFVNKKAERQVSVFDTTGLKKEDTKAEK